MQERQNNACLVDIRLLRAASKIPCWSQLREMPYPTKYAGNGYNLQTGLYSKLGEMTHSRLDICIAHLGSLFRLMLQPPF